jgi:isopropylmalate/homocitrate/citramalate synthase
MDLLRTSAGTFPLIEREEPELYRDQFPYSSVPRIRFDGVDVPMRLPDDIWITDTTFRDGQQARPPYTPEQIARIYDFLHRLAGERGLVRQTEFFLYSEKDRRALELCQERGYRYPEITGWIRADKGDFQLVRSLGLKETGILFSVSDYHIFLKLKSDRRRAMDSFLGIVQDALAEGILPRCHFEDITRADIYGFCLPLAERLLGLARESGIPVKVRLCDTMGYGLTYPGAALPRSVPRLVHAFRTELGYPAEWLEWHGHNDFHKVHINAATAWLYGCAANNCSLLGYGERTGNPPLEAAVIEYMSLTGDDSVDAAVITEMAEYFRREVRADIPANYPFVGEDFNTTRAGIHADGILKNPEIYNIFDTERILSRPIRTMVTDKSGYAGIARWLNENVPSVREGRHEEVTKRHPGIKHIAQWVEEEYQHGRTTAISSEELMVRARRFLPGLFESDFDRVREEAVRIAKALAEDVGSAPQLARLDPAEMDDYLQDIVKREGSIQLLAITNTEGKRISQIYAQHGEKALFRNLLSKDFSQKEWFKEVLRTGEPYFSHLFFSIYTGRLILTAALPLRATDGSVRAVLDIDFRFDELVKLINTLPEGLVGERDAGEGGSAL